MNIEGTVLLTSLAIFLLFGCFMLGREMGERDLVKEIQNYGCDKVVSVIVKK